MEVHYDHLILFLQHMVWDEGYHHGQMKLALKSVGPPLSDEQAGPVTWDIWLDQSPGIYGWIRTQVNLCGLARQDEALAIPFKIRRFLATSSGKVKIIRIFPT